MNKKHVSAVAFVAVSVAASLLNLYWLTHQPLTIRFGVRELKAQNIGWNMPLAKAEFNLTAHNNFGDPIRIERVEVDGMRADFYPETLSIENGETVNVKAHFPYRSSVEYEFSFCDDDGSNYKIVSISPAE